MNRYSLILLLLPLLLNAEPIRFERLYNEKTEKTIDLIFDLHKYVYDPIDQKNTELAQDLEISDSVRGLLTSLDSIASNSATPVDLYLETSEYHHYNPSYESTATPEQERDWALIDLYDNGSLWVVDRWLSEHTKKTGSKLKIINADTYRDNHLITLIWTMLSASFINPSVSKQVKMASYQGVFTWFENLLNRVGFIDDDLTKLEYKDSSMYAMIIAEWETFQQQYLQPFYQQFVKEFIDKKMMLPSAINKIKLRGLLPGKAGLKVFERKFLHIVQRVADFELLIKVLNSYTDHSIIYAGSAHGYYVAKFLQEKAGFKPLIQVGYEISKQFLSYDSQIPVGVSMTENTWNFLLYNGKDDQSVIQKTLAHSVVNSISRYHDDKDKLIPLISIAQKNYINIIRYMYYLAIKDNMPRFLYALLVNYPEYINAYFSSELNPLIYAIEKRNEDLVEEILSSDYVNRNITNYMHASPRNAAKKAGDAWVRLLRRKHN